MGRPFDQPETARILAFLGEIGIAVEFADLPGETFLPGMAVRRGTLIVDPERLQWPGDLLHEAGHIAVSDPALRSACDDVSPDPGEEMAAIAWSYAAARAAGIDTRTLFHADGYLGGGEALAAAFDRGAGPGPPMLQYFGMSAEPHQAAALGLPAYPRMARWLR